MNDNPRSRRNTLRSAAGSSVSPSCTPHSGITNPQNVRRLNPPDIRVSGITPTGSKVVSSTPNQSLSRSTSVLTPPNYNSASGDNYMTTPLIDSAGTALTTLPEIPDIKDVKNAQSLEYYFDQLSIHVAYFGTNLGSEPDWSSRIHSTYNALLELVSPGQIKASELNNQRLITKFSSLSSQLEAHKLKWSLAVASETSLSDFNGFTSTLHANVSRGTDQSIISRLTALEGDRFHLKSLGQRLSLISERVGILEHSPNELLSRVDVIDSSIQSLNALPEQLSSIEHRLTDLESKHSAHSNPQSEDFSSLKDQVELLNNKVDNLLNVSTGISLNQESIRALSTQIVSNAHSLRADFNSFKSNMINLTTSKQSKEVNPEFHQYSPPGPGVHNSQTPINPLTQSASNIRNQNFIHSTAPVCPTGNNANTQGRVSNWLDSNAGHVHGNKGSDPPAFNGQHNFKPISPQVEFMNRPVHHGNISVNNDDNNSVHSSVVSTLNLQGKLLQDQMNGLVNLLSPSISDELSKHDILDLHKNKVVAVEMQTRDLNRALRDYCKTPGFSYSFGERVSDVISDAIKWTSKIRELYQSKGASRKSQGNMLYDTIPVFDNNSDIDIFDFLKRFEASTEDFEFDHERALLLYNKFLSPVLQEETTKFKNDYDAMKRTLIHRYGDPKTIMHNLLSPVTKDHIPDSSDIVKSLSYLRKLQSTLEKISSMLSAKDNEDVESYIYSQDFLHHLLTLVPQDAKNEFFKIMDRCNEDTIRIKGRTAFKLLLNSVNEAYQLADRSCRTKANIAPPSKAKKEPERARQVKTFHANETGNESDDSNDSHSTYTSAIGPNQALFERKEAKPPKPVSKTKFPCLIPNHKHSIAECREFFLKTPLERVELKKKFRYRYCSTCLQSSELCKGRTCGNNEVPDVLVCNDCRIQSKPGRPRIPFCVLFCFSDKHQKPSNASLLEGLEKYIPGFQSSLLKTPVILASHFQVLSSSKSAPKPKSLSRPMNPNESPPVFNTCTGDQEDSSDIECVKETYEDSIAVMQTLNIKGRHVLTLFDRGANQHLVEGQLAEELSFKVVNEEPAAIGVVSGGNIWTSYGSYSTFLGPNSKGKYYEIIAQGMSAITSSFPRYDLAELNTEAMQHSNLPLETKLPPYIGGDRVKLLIGLKASEMEPECVFVIPNGVGIYKSQFIDAHGSRYCYGGPSKIFTAVNKRFNGSVNFMTVFFTQAISQYRNSLYPSIMSNLEPNLVDTGHGVHLVADPILDYSQKSCSGHDFFPTPLTCKDFTEAGKPVEDEEAISSADCPLNHCICIATSYAYKAKIPLSKQRDYLDEDDIDETINYRCDQCQKCKCNSSNRLKMISLNEKIEQEQIKASVHVNLEKERVEVDLPFIKDPDKYLSEKHGGNDNYSQAHRVYKSQCRFPDSVKDEIRNVHSDLIEKGFLKKLSDLPPEHQSLVGGNRFSHFMPWRIVRKDSTTTPVRLVVDPSMSGLNLCLAKGENRMRKINDILVRARCRKYLWSSDISKLYNRLYLKPSSYTYQLFLFHTSLDPNIPPEVYVLVRCWYGVTSSANQATYALEELSRLLKDEYPLAFEVIHSDMYVDDLLPGSSSLEIVNEQIRQVSEVLQKGGFFPKFIIQSGQEIQEEFIRILGYKWNVMEDSIAPGFTELNFSKKKRGMKAPNPFPIRDPSDVVKILDSVDLTRRTAVSKTAELFDPLGKWEPYKIQLKLGLQLLNGMDWDLPLSQENQDFWLSKFQEFLEIPNMKVERYIFPPDVPAENIRLLCLSDAAENAGGGCIYAGVKLPDGSFSCKLLASRSKLLKESIPRNELESIRITAGLAYDVKQALGDLVTDVIFVTDSSVALSWCQNTNKRLRLYCLNRVAEIRRLIFSICGKSDSLPLFHIDGKLNLADLLTKPNNISPKDISYSSDWHSGLSWMLKPKQDMPLTSFEQIQISSQQNQAISTEYFPEVSLPSQNNQDVVFSAIHCDGCHETNGHFSIHDCHGSSLENLHCLNCSCSSHSSVFFQSGKGAALIDILSTGYSKAISVMSRVNDFIWSLKHKVHTSKGIIRSQLCKKCTTIELTNGIQVEYDKFLMKESKDYFFRLESSRLSKVLPPAKLKGFILKDGIYFNKSRIDQDAKVVTEDLDFSIFFDGQDIHSSLPVVSSDSELFYSILMHIHHNVRRHSGTEATLRELTKVVFPIGNARKIVLAVRKHCPRCRLILRKTFELEMGNHPQSRYQIVPAFYHSMCDIVYGFKGKPFKTARKPELKIYGLVIVCILTSATSILALEGIETQDIVLALERHSARHGVPAALYLDQGTQLTSLNKLEVSLRDANSQLRESLGLKILPSIAKNHMSRGRVERKIRSLRDMLKKVAIDTAVAMTPLQWDTIFARMSSDIDDIPMARSDNQSHLDFGWELLTPNRFKLGRANNRSIHGPLIISESTSPTQLLKRVHDIQRYWYQLLLDRLHHLIPKPDNWSKSDEVKLQDIVVFRFKDNVNTKMEVWKIGKVVEILKEGRGVIISYPQILPNGVSKLSVVNRSVRDICLVSSIDDLNLNSKEFFDKIKKIN